VIEHVVEGHDQAAQLVFHIDRQALVRGGIAQQVAGLAQVVFPLAHVAQGLAQ